MLKKLFLTGVLGAAAFLFAGAGTAKADRCNENKVRNEQWQLQRDIQRHGFFSRQAQHRREKIQRLRQQCGGFGWNRDRDRRWDRDRNGRWDRDRDRDDRRGDRDRDNRWRRDRDRDRNGWYWDGRSWRRR